MRGRSLSLIGAAAMTFVVAGMPSSAKAGAIINGVITSGLNTVTDNDAESVTSVVTPGATTLQVGDVITDVLTFNSISNLAGGPLNGLLSILGPAYEAYQLAGLATFTVQSIDGNTTVGYSSANPTGVLVLSGTVSLYETPNSVAAGNTIKYTTQSLATQVANATSGTNILNLSGFVVGVDNSGNNTPVPLTFAGIASTPAASPTVFGGGFDVTSNPQNVNIAIGTGGGGTFQGTGYDMTVKVDDWGNQGANKSTVGILSQTTATFSPNPAPEPASLLIWGGFAAVAGVSAMRRRRSAT